MCPGRTSVLHLLTSDPSTVVSPTPVHPHRRTGVLATLQLRPKSPTGQSTPYPGTVRLPPPHVTPQRPRSHGPRRRVGTRERSTVGDARTPVHVVVRPEEAHGHRRPDVPGGYALAAVAHAELGHGLAAVDGPGLTPQGHVDVRATQPAPVPPFGSAPTRRNLPVGALVDTQRRRKGSEVRKTRVSDVSRTPLTPVRCPGRLVPPSRSVYSHGPVPGARRPLAHASPGHHRPCDPTSVPSKDRVQVSTRVTP